MTLRLTDPPWARLTSRIFPRSPDFFALLDEQCRMVTLALDTLVDFLESGDPKTAAKVADIEHEADKLKATNMRILNEAFATPIDREDIYRAISSLDEIVNYCKTTVREMEALDLGPDHYSLDMVFRLKEGAESLQRGFGSLSSDSKNAERQAHLARRAERLVEKIYRRALAALFQGDDYIEMFKRRELYRHLSNAADRMADASHVLLDIVVKIS